MSRKDGRGQIREILILLAFGAPGAGLFIWGIRSCAAAHHFGMPGAIGVFTGLGLVIAGGYYHYRTDYREGPGKHPLKAFIGVTAFSLLATYIVNHVLFR